MNKALQELKDMDKTMENTKAYVKKHLAYMAFHWHSVHGFPVEMFQEEMNLKNISLAEQLAMIIKFYEKH
jgi:hypothetical protein